MGIDLVVDSGTPIRAAAAGIIANFSGWINGSAGYGVWVVHPDGWVTKYFHLRPDSNFLSFGTPVKTGDIIGLVGRTGCGATNTPPSANPTCGVDHLHFEAHHPIWGAVDAWPIINEGDDLPFIPPPGPGSPPILGPGQPIPPIDYGNISVPFTNIDEFEALPCATLESFILQLRQGEELSGEELAKLMGFSLKDLVGDPHKAEIFRRARQKVVDCGLEEKGLIEAVTEPIGRIVGFLRLLFSVRSLYVAGGAAMIGGGAWAISKAIR